MTTTQILWRLTWKEYRVQRALWWTVLVLTFIAEGLIGLTVDLLGGQPLTASGHLVVVFGAVSVYLLGCGATLFALEHEQGTFEFQRLLPAAFGNLLVAKMGVGYLSGLALGCVLLVPTMLLPGSVFRETTLEDWWAGCVTFTEIFLWAVFFSLMLRDPLRAAVSGIVGASLVACAVFPVLDRQAWADDLLVFHRSSLGPRSLAALALLVVNAGVARRWFQGGTPTNWLPSPRDWFPKGSDLVLRPAGVTIPRYLGGERTGFGRLVGVTWRQGKWFWIVSVALFAVALMAALGSPKNAQPVTIVWFYSLILSSWCSFGLDQRGNQFRYYAEHGVDARWLWLSRHVVWFTPVLLISIISQWVLFPNTELRNPSTLDVFVRQSGVVVFTLMSYPVGQVWAMAIRRAPLAFVVVFFSIVLLFGWLALMVVGEVPCWLSMLPIPVVCLYATWRFAPNWIEERCGKRHRWEVFAVFGVPAAIVLPAIAAQRVYSIPASPPIVAVSEYTRPMTESERETLSLYTLANQELAAATMAAGGKTSANASNQSQSLAASHEARALDLLRKAHRRHRVPVTMTPPFVGDEPTSTLGNFDAFPLVDLVHREAIRLTNQGKLAEAWQAYEIAFELLERIRLRGGPESLIVADGWESNLLRLTVWWASQRDQTSSLLAGAQQRLADWDAGVRSDSSTTVRLVKIDYVLWNLFLQGDSTAAAELGLSPSESASMRLFTWLLPWEVARCRRVADQFMLWWSGRMTDMDEKLKIARMRDSTLLRYFGYREPWNAQSQRYPDADTERSATRILVALIAWRREHQGELPGQLHDLVGPFLPQVPRDVAKANEFFYSASGSIREIRIDRPETSAARLPKDVGFLWLPGDTGLAMMQEPSGEIVVSAATEAAARDAMLQLGLQQGLLWLIPPYQAPSPRP